MDPLPRLSLLNVDPRKMPASASLLEAVIELATHVAAVRDLPAVVGKLADVVDRLVDELEDRR